MAKVESTLVIPDYHNELAGLNTEEYLHLNVAEKEKFDNLQLYLDSKVDENSPIEPGSFSKITYDAKGLVTGGSKAAISDITSLQDALDAKMTGNASITGGTYTKVTFDSKGLVTAGSNANTSDIPDSSNKRYVLDSDLIKLGNTSGINTGDQNLNYIASLTDGTVELSNGDDAIIPLATEFHAGLLSPPEKALIETAVQPGELDDIAFSGEVQWSSIVGDINLQTDLQNQFDTKFNIPTGTIDQYLDGLGNPKDFPATQDANRVAHDVKAGESMAAGQAVYISDYQGTNIVVSKASNTSELLSSKTLGLITTDLFTNEQGKVVTEGLLSGLDTSMAQEKDPVWLGEDGNLIYGYVNKPKAPKHLVYIGLVTRINSNNGEIFVRVQNGFELEELHNVKIDNPLLNQVIQYNSENQLYENDWTFMQYVTGFITKPVYLNGGTNVVDGYKKYEYEYTFGKRYRKVITSPQLIDEFYLESSLTNLVKKRII